MLVKEGLGISMIHHAEIRNTFLVLRGDMNQLNLKVLSPYLIRFGCKRSLFLEREGFNAQIQNIKYIQK